MPSRANLIARTAFLSVVLAGCATSAPPLPPDTTSVNRTQSLTLDSFAKEDAALSCEQIGAERQQIDQSLRDANGRIEGNRTQNQVAGYFGALILVPLVATDNNDAEKAEITRIYGRRDMLIKLGGVKGCA